MNVSLRPLEDRDLDTIYEQVTHPELVRMAAFTADDPRRRSRRARIAERAPLPERRGLPPIPHQIVTVMLGRSQLGLALFRGECGFGGAQPRRA